MHVPQAKNASPRKGRSADEPNRMEELKREIEELKNQLAKKSRDDLDAMYNIDADNLSPSLKRLFASWSDGDNTGMAEIKAEVDSVKAEIKSITEWQSETGKNIASITQTATNNGASITQIVTSIGDKDGKVTAASIAAKISGDDSLIQLIADKVEIEGVANFVTQTEMEAYVTSTEISGNKIKMELPFVNDPDSEYAEEATAQLMFVYDPEIENVRMARIYTKFDGSGGADGAATDDNKFALVISTDQIRHVFDVDVYENYNTALKLEAAGGLSLRSNSLNSGIYTYSMGYTTFHAEDNVRIRARYSYSTTADANSTHPAADNDYVFASDGIYYGGTKILDV